MSPGSRFLVAIFVCLFTTATHAAWTRRLEPFTGTQQNGIAPLPDGGFVVALNGKPANAVITLDASGAVKAARKLDELRVTFVTTTSSGDIYLGVEKYRGSDEERYIRLVKLRSDLSVVWARRVVSPDEQPYYIAGGAGTRDGGIVVFKRILSGVVLTKIDSRGDIEWSTHVDPNDREFIHSIRQTRDGGYIAAGSSPRHPWLVRLDASGTLRWQKAYGPAPGDLQSVAETPDGAFLAVGRGHGTFIMKTDANGNVVWTKGTNAVGHALSVVTNDDGSISSFSTEDALFLVSLGRDGSTKWQRRYHAPDRSLMLEFYNSTLAPSRNGAALTIPFGTAPAAVFEIDRSGAIPNCGWFSEGGLALQDRVARSEDVAIEVTSPDVATRPTEVALTAFDVKATTETCVAAEQPVWAKPAPIPERKILPFRAVEDSSAVKGQYTQLLLARRFSELDDIAEKLRNAGPSRDPIRPKQSLMTFYEAMTNDEETDEARLALLREWVASRPQSVAARIALAEALLVAAGNVRGGGYADSVIAAAWEQYGKLRDEAKKALDTLGKRGESDRQYWQARITLAREHGVEEVLRVGRKALAIHLDPDLASAVSAYLYPQWGGSPEIYMVWADEATAALRSIYGEGAYLWLVHRIQNYHSSEDYKQYKVDWEHVLKGAEDLIGLKPDWPPTYHRIAKLAHRYKDHKTARAYFQRPELEWYTDAHHMWGSREFYEMARRWAELPEKK